MSKAIRFQPSLGPYTTTAYHHLYLVCAALPQGEYNRKIGEMKQKWNLEFILPQKQVEQEST